MEKVARKMRRELTGAGRAVGLRLSYSGQEQGAADLWREHIPRSALPWNLREATWEHDC